MPHRVRTHPDLAAIVALARALEREEQRPAGEITDRDRQLAQRLPEDGADRAALALAWLNAVEREDETVWSLHQRAETALQLTGLLVFLAAVLLGSGATLAAFYFDGSGRVNAVLVLALLVALPALLILPFIVAALPGGIVQKVPGAGVLAALARVLTPGRLALLLWRAFPRNLRDAMALFSGRMEKHRRLYSTLQKWALLRWSQLFAAGFQITAVAACLVLVVFTDLAFGWSTTLTTGDPGLDARRAHRITSALAEPWAWALTDAQPSLALIEESRYFRVASESVSRTQAARLGGWWKFVVLSMVVYGLLPRVITLAAAHSRLRAAARAAAIASPGLSAALRRIHRARVETAAIEPESAEDAPPGVAAEAPVPPATGGVRAVINWSGVPVEPAVLAAVFPEARVFAAGGTASVQDDATLAGQLAGITGVNGAADVVVVVKAWEPPLMEFIDFLKTLREALARKAATIFVLPVGLDAGATLGGATSPQLKLWRDKLTAIGDPWLRVAASQAEVQG